MNVTKVGAVMRTRPVVVAPKTNGSSFTTFVLTVAAVTTAQPISSFVVVCAQSVRGRARLRQSLATRRIHIACTTPCPDGQWMIHVARNVTMTDVGFLSPIRYMNHDRERTHGSGDHPQSRVARPRVGEFHHRYVPEEVRESGGNGFHSCALARRD